MSQTGAPSAGADIARLEELVGAELPADYAGFLRTAGGGAFRENQFVAISHDGIVGNVCQPLYSESRKAGLEQVSEASRNLIDVDLMPPTALQIASTPDGSAIMLSVEPGSTFGKVYFGDQPPTDLVTTSSMADFEYFFACIGDSFHDFVTTGLCDEAEYERRLQSAESQPLPPAPPQPTHE